jgi:hypothetical protein
MPLLGTSAVPATAPVREGISALPTSCRPLLLLFRPCVGAKTQTLALPRRMARFFNTVSCTCLPNPKKLACLYSPIPMRRITPACEREHSQKTFPSISIELPLRARLRSRCCLHPSPLRQLRLHGGPLSCVSHFTIERYTSFHVPPPQMPCAAGLCILKN